MKERPSDSSSTTGTLSEAKVREILQSETKARRDLETFANKILSEVEKQGKRLKKVEDDLSSSGASWLKEKRASLKAVDNNKS